MKVLTWDGTGAIVVHKKLDAGRFELPRATRIGAQHVMVSDAVYNGIGVFPKSPRRRIHRAHTLHVSLAIAVAYGSTRRRTDVDCQRYTFPGGTRRSGMHAALELVAVKSRLRESEAQTFAARDHPEFHARNQLLNAACTATRPAG